MPLERLVAALARAPLFRDVELPQLRLLAFSAGRRAVARGGVIAAAGATDTPAYLVTSGIVGAAGKEIAPGGLINAPGALAGIAVPAQIVAKTDVRLLVIDRALVARLIGEYPAMGRSMMRSLGFNLRGQARAIRMQILAAGSQGGGRGRALRPRATDDPETRA